MLEMLRMIREQEPPKPSTKLSTADGLAGARRQPRNGAGEADEAGPRRAGLDRDEGSGEGPQPAVRDGQRLRDGRAARTWRMSRCRRARRRQAYRLRKFVRRHKGPVLAGSLILLALVAGVIGTT